MTRLESGARPVRKDWHPLEEVVGAALAALGERLRRPPRRRPTCRRTCRWSRIDAVLIEQVLVNLLDNAIKYTPGRQRRSGSRRPRGRRARVTVADEGPGLPPGEEERVFEKFYRGERAPSAARPGAPHLSGHRHRPWRPHLGGKSHRAAEPCVWVHPADGRGPKRYRADDA